MSLLIGVSFAVVAVLLYRVKGSGTVLFPPALMAMYWAVIVSLTGLIGFKDVRLRPEALLVFSLGVVFFVVGSLPALLFGQMHARRSVKRALSATRRVAAQKAIFAFSVIAILALCWYVAVLVPLAKQIAYGTLWQSMRLASQTYAQSVVPLQFCESIFSISSVLASLAAWLYNGSRRDAFAIAAAGTAPLAAGLITFSKTNVAALLVGVLAILWFRRAIAPKVVVLGACALIGSFVLIMFALSSGTQVAGPYWFLDRLSTYFLGGPVGFSEIMNNAQQVGQPGLSYGFALQFLQRLGLYSGAPDFVLGYFSPEFGNVYTWFYAYWLDSTWLGVLIVSMFAGLICTASYVGAQRGNPIAGVAMGRVTYAILNSANGDLLFLSATPWLLIVIVVAIVTHLPVQRHQVRWRRRASIPRPVTHE